MNEEQKTQFLDEVASRNWKQQHHVEANRLGITLPHYILILLSECFSKPMQFDPQMGKTQVDIDTVSNDIKIRRGIKSFENNRRVRNTLSKTWNGTIDTVCAAPVEDPLTPRQREHYSRVLEECKRMDQYFQEQERKHHDPAK